MSLRVKRLNKVLYFPLFFFFVIQVHQKQKANPLLYTVRKLLEQILLCIPDFSIKK